MQTREWVQISKTFDDFVAVNQFELVCFFVCF